MSSLLDVLSTMIFMIFIFVFVIAIIIAIIGLMVIISPFYLAAIIVIFIMDKVYIRRR